MPKKSKVVLGAQDTNSPPKVPSIRDHMSSLSLRDVDATSIVTSKRAWSLEDFEIGCSMGEGSFGKVYLARDVEKKHIVALKVYSKKKMDKSSYGWRESCKALRNEIEIQKDLRHDGIVRLYAIFQDARNFYLTLEYCDGGETLKNDMSVEKVVEAFVQVADALVYMHGKGVMHLDIKPENILWGRGNRIKVADFGHSFRGIRGRMFRGTTEYLSPEMLLLLGKSDEVIWANDLYYTKTTDTWSCGVLLFEWLCNRSPFFKAGEADESPIKARIQQGKFGFPRNPNFSPGAKDLISKLMKYDPTKRLDLQEIRGNAWIVRNLPESQQQQHSL